MRLSGWRTKAPGRDGINPKILDTVGSILTALGAEADPHCWVTWGDETASRWALMAPCPAGLAVVNVRAGGPQEGSRAGGRLVRWSKVQVGELAAEAEQGHRLVMFQLEGQPIRGADEQADDVAAFAGLTLAGIEGRPLPDLDRGVKRQAVVPTRSTGKPSANRAIAAAAQPGSPGPVARSAPRPEGGAAARSPGTSRRSAAG
jgi:hypothetical protein